MATTLILKTCNIQYILNNVTYFFFRTRLLFGRIFNKVDYFFLNLLLTPFFSLLFFSSILLFFAFMSVVPPPLRLHFLSLLLLIFSKDKFSLKHGTHLKKKKGSTKIPYLVNIVFHSFFSFFFFVRNTKHCYLSK